MIELKDGIKDLLFSIIFQVFIEWLLEFKLIRKETKSNIVSYYHRRTLSHNFLRFFSNFHANSQFIFTTHTKDITFSRFIFAIHQFESNLTGIWFHTSLSFIYVDAVCIV